MNQRLIPRIILASSSPRRAALLAEAGIAFEPLDPGVKDGDEEELAARWRARGLAPADVARRLAVAKALAASRKQPVSARAPSLVLAADTVVALDGRVLGKPRDKEDAKGMIELLAGATHEVTTGVALLDLETGKLEAETETSRVSFRKIDATTLESFLASGTWAGKAGAYGVQDAECQPLVAAVEGSRSNVVGLPVERVRALLARVAVALVATLALAGCPDRKPESPPGPPPPPQTPPAVAAPSTLTQVEEPVTPQDYPFVPHKRAGLPSRGLPEVKLTIGGVVVTAELATSEAARQLGLMHRKTMDENHGMLFVYPEDQKDFHNFWMQNCHFPQSLAYIRDDGTIVNIEDMAPFDETTKHWSKERVRLGLELNKGWYLVHHVGPGDKIEGITPEILAKGE